MDLNEIAVFLKVVQLGSFTKAAAALGMPNSTVSAKISALEKRLGLTLIQRTTRKLAATAVGQIYYDRCVLGLREFEAAEVEVLNDRGEPHGLLRLTTPVDLGNSVLPELLTEFTATYPRVRVEVILTDRQVHLIEENVDLALRAGILKDSSLVARKIADVGFSLFAAPRFLKQRGTPARPADVAKFECLRFTAFGEGPWHLVHGADHVEISPPSRVRLNDLNLVKTMAVRGAGIALLPTYFCANELHAGTLTALFPEWSSARAPLQFVYPAQKYVPAHVTAFIQMAVVQLRTLLGA